MARPLRYLGILIPALFVIGCSENADSPPTGPEFHTITPTTVTCDAQHLSQLASSYFRPPKQQTAKTLVDAIAASQRSLTAKNNGFNIMALIETALGDGSAGDPSVGSDLINHLLLCMYDPSSEAASYPASFPDTFTVALTPSMTGAFGERSSGLAPVYARSSTFTFGFSGIAPTADWGTVSGSNTPPRVVFYGRPATSSDGTAISGTYDWRTIPHNANFDPNIVIAVCVEASGNTLMLNEQGVAILSFVDAGFLDPNALDPAPRCSTSNMALLEGNSPFQLAHRLLHLGTNLLTPRPLMAAAVSPGGVGGSSSKCCSKVGTKNVPSVALTLSSVSSVIRLSDRFSLTATTMSGNDPVNGTKVTLSTMTNNGAGTSIRVAPSGTSCASGPVPQGITGTGTNPAGAYTFTNLCFTSTGNIFIVGTANVEGRGDTPATATSNKINVKP